MIRITENDLIDRLFSYTPHARRMVDTARETGCDIERYLPDYNVLLRIVDNIATIIVYNTEEMDINADKISYQII